MALLSWSEDLNVGVDFMDSDHQVFIDMVNAFAQADEADLPALFDALYAHTEEHFAREEALMDKIKFFATDCHKGEHGRVLNEMRRFREHLSKGNIAFARAYVTDQIPQWFILHRNTMDSATAAYANQHAAAEA
jgi:hemerythrin